MKELKDYLHLYLGCECIIYNSFKGSPSYYAKGDKVKLTHQFLIDMGADGHCIYVPERKCKLILRPLSDMTKEIEHNGSKFIPLKVLAGMAGTCSPEDWVIKSEYEVEHKTAKGCTFRITSSCDFIMKRSEKWKDFEVCSQQIKMFLKIIEWRFDIGGLIEAGLAIDKTTLKQSTTT